MDRILREERKYLLDICKKIQKTGCNVLLIQKSILRDAVTDLSLQYLAKMKIMVVKDIERDEIEYISKVNYFLLYYFYIIIIKTLGCQPIASIEHFTAEKLGKLFFFKKKNKIFLLGSADLVEEVSTGEDKIVKITGIKHPGKTVAVLVRGSNKLVVDEAERSIHDSLCVIRCLVKKRFYLLINSYK